MVILQVYYGTSLFGKVDHCPGLFYVATRFFHLTFVPLIPLASYLVIDGTASEQEVSCAPLGLSGKSVLFAYFRTAMVLGGSVLAIAATVATLMAIEPGAAWLPPVILAALSVLCWVLFPLSYKLSHASAARAVRLAEKAGIDRRIVAEYFLNGGVLPGPEKAQESAPPFVYYLDGGVMPKLDKYEESAPPSVESVDEPRTP